MKGRAESWIVIDWATVPLIVFDFLLIVALVAWGLTTHHVDPLDRPLYTLQTAAPFLVGWLIMAPVAGALSRQARSRVTFTGIAAGASWLGAAIIGSAIRATPLLPGGADPVFVLVMVGTGLVIMVPWRVLVVLSRARWGD